MQKIKLFMAFLVFFCNFMYPQIDTSIHFPLATGNYWEYHTYSETYVVNNYVTVVGDTLMDNGKTYRKLKVVDGDKNTYYSTGYMYFRVVDNYYVYKYISDTSCSEREFLIFNLAAPVKTFWELCGYFSHASVDKRYYGLHSVFLDYDMGGQLYERKYFSTVVIRNKSGRIDTIWSPIQGTLTEYFFVSGIGIIRQTLGSAYPDLVLTGAIINGIKYGPITGIKDNKNSNELYSMVDVGVNPNPFNGQTNIKVYNNKLQHVELSIYDILGRQVISLYKGDLEKGNYNFQFNSSGLSSGTYLVCLRTPLLIKTYKMLNLK